MEDIVPAVRKAGTGGRIRELGITLPKPPTPLGHYVEWVQHGSLLFLSGTLPIADGNLAFRGRLGANLSIKDGQAAARLAALNALALAQEHLGDLDRVKRLVRLTVFMVTTEDFTTHAAVGDGASDLFADIFGPDLGHVRAVVGVQSLPLGAPVIVDALFEVG